MITLLKTKTTWFLFVLTIFGIYYPGQAQNQSMDQFLDRIKAQLESHPDYRIYSMDARTKIEEMDKNWQPKKTTLIEKTVYQQHNSQREEIHKAILIEKGEEKDITEKSREKAAKERKKKQDGSFEFSSDKGFPFSQEMRSYYTFTLTPDSLWMDRKVMVLHAKAREKSRKLYEGHYFIDPQTYEILGCDIRPAKNPRFIKLMRLRMRFSVLPSGYFVVDDFWMKVYGSVIIKKFRFVIHETYSNYQIEEN